MNTNWRSLVYFEECDLYEHDLDYYMSLTSEDVAERSSDWFAEIHFDQDMGDELQPRAEFVSDVMDHLKNNIVNFDDVTAGRDTLLPLNVRCYCEPYYQEGDGIELWNVLIKTLADRDNLVKELESGKRTFWPD